LRNRLGYGWALSSFELTNILLLVTVIGFGSEHKGRRFLRDREV
jgi:hypothetical protein